MLRCTQSAITVRGCNTNTYAKLTLHREGPMLLEWGKRRVARTLTILGPFYVSKQKIVSSGRGDGEQEGRN